MQEKSLRYFLSVMASFVICKPSGNYLKSKEIYLKKNTNLILFIFELYTLKLQTKFSQYIFLSQVKNFSLEGCKLYEYKQHISYLSSLPPTFPFTDWLYRVLRNFIHCDLLC